LRSTFVLVALLVVACDDERRRTPRTELGPSGPCFVEPGKLPSPTCDDARGACAPAGACAIDEARCGASSTCLPLASNLGSSVKSLRIRRLNVTAPAALASALIQQLVVTANIDLAAPTCGENGTGQFSWLLRVDTEANVLTTGGALPTSDPFARGYCFAETTIGTTPIAPIQLRIERTGNTFRTVEERDVNIPIFQSNDPTNAFVLPISAARIEGATLSDGGDCIGRFEARALDGTCTEDRTVCAKWRTAGALGGFITLETADRVLLRELGNRSLCAFLAGETSLTCARDANGRIRYRGDYCSTERAAGGCADSVWLAATFAASAVRIETCR